MHSNRFTIVMLMLASVLTALCQTFTLVPPRNVVEGRNFALTFRLTDGEANPPTAPQLEGCKLLFGPSTSTMSSTQYINGKMSSSYSVDYTFTYRAERAGDVNVPALSVNVEGKTLSSRAATFKILPADNTSSSAASNGNQAQPNRRPTQTAGRVSSDDIFVRVSFSKSSVYEQEPVVATIKIYTKYDISSFLPTTQPAFEGFLTEELPTDMESSMEHYNGQNYYTATLKRLLLYPQRAGKLSVNSGKYDVTIVQYEAVNMGFFQTSRPVESQITTSSNAATITVHPLPEPRPAGFNGAVGSFTVDTSLEPELLRTNEAAVYSYTVKGQGNIKFLSEPEIHFPAGIDAYTPKTDINANVIGGGTDMSGTFRTDITFVPQEVGNFEIQGTPFVYFDLNSKSYKTIDVPSTPIKVLRGNSAAPVVQHSTDIEGAIDDILHIHNINADEQSFERAYTLKSIGYWIAYIIVILTFVSLVIVYRRQIRLNADVSGRRLAKASRVATKRLKEAKGYMDRHEKDKFYDAVARALWGYMSDKLSIPSSQLTRDNIASKLEAYGLESDKTSQVLEVLDLCEMARFTPVHSDDEINRLYEQASAVINSIQNVAKR